MQIHLATAAGYKQPQYQQGLLIWSCLGEKATKMLSGSTEFQPATLAIWTGQVHSQTDFLLRNPRPKIWGGSNGWDEWILPWGATNKSCRTRAIWWAGTDVSLLCIPCMCCAICTVWVVPSCRSCHRCFHRESLDHWPETNSPFLQNFRICKPGNSAGQSCSHSLGHYWPKLILLKCHTFCVQCQSTEQLYNKLKISLQETLSVVLICVNNVISQV